MRFLHGLVGLLIFTVLLGAVACVFFMASIGPDAWSKFLEYLSQERVAVLLAGVAFCLLLFLFVLTTSRRGEGGKYLTFDSEAGPISVNKTAVRDMIKKTGDEFAAVLTIHPTIAPHRKKLDVAVDLRVRSGTQVPELCKMIQDRVRETLHDNMGLSAIRQVKVNVREIVASPEDRSLGDAGGKG